MLFAISRAPFCSVILCIASSPPTTERISKRPALICHLVERIIIITSDNHALISLCLLLLWRDEENWSLLSLQWPVGLFVERERKTPRHSPIASYFFFVTSELYQILTRRLMYPSNTCLSIQAYLPFSPVPGGPRAAGDWLINIIYVQARHGQLNRQWTFEQRDRTLMASHWPHEGLVLGSSEGRRRTGGRCCFPLFPPSFSPPTPPLRLSHRGELYNTLVTESNQFFFLRSEIVVDREIDRTSGE